jgi:hypothetical protein
MTPALASKRSLRAIGLAALACLAAQPAAAQKWIERPYDPPVGSRWSVVTQAESDETRVAGERNMRQISTRAEFTVEQKLPDGYRIAYVNREIKMTGTAPGTDIAEAAFGAMKDIVIRARTDAAGKPLVVENIDEVKLTMAKVVERIATAFEKKPQVAALVRQMMNGILLVDGATAASVYMEDLPVLAAGQNTGLQPGASRREEEQVPSPFGAAAIKSVLITRLTSWDEATGKARFTRTREMDREALKQVTIDIASRLITASGDKDSPEMIAALKQISFSVDNEVVIDVEGGMTRAIEDRSTTLASVMGQTFRKVEKKVVRVTPLK